MEKFKEELYQMRNHTEELMNHLQSKVNKLEGDIASLEGQIFVYKKNIEILNKSLELNEYQKEIIEFLYSRGYRLRWYNEINPNAPEFIFRRYRQVRVCVNPQGIMILMDPGAGTVMHRDEWFINPNAKRMDFNKYCNTEMKKSIIEFEKRSKFDSENDPLIKSLIDGGWI